MHNYYTIQQAAEYLNCSTRRIYYLVQRRRLQPCQTHPMLFTGDELQRLANDPKRLKALARQRPLTSKRTRESAY